RQGVRDFVQKPWDNASVLSVVQALTAERQGRRREQRSREREQAEAREIQRGLLPEALPQVAGWDLAAACVPAAAVGGDLYDVFALDDRTVAFMIADVAGKGVPAALLAAAVQASVRGSAKSGVRPSEVCAEVNRALCGHIPSNRFVTFFYGTLDTGSGVFTYTNAGHNPPLVAASQPAVGPGQPRSTSAHWAPGPDRRGQPAEQWAPVSDRWAAFDRRARASSEWAPASACRAEAAPPRGPAPALRLGCGGVMLGIDAGARWRDQSVSILPGDALLLYTDGLTEARSEAGEEFGEERLASALRSRAALPSDALVASLVEEVAGFGPVQEDDRTLVVAQRTP
ncbi:MAG: serine/threonine-protein phosphatase, partial [Acidobacteria bacterium]|nr:serine/threonine-protein phosphatase [Acidobacteriota bacterium]